HAVTKASSLHEHLARQIREFEPTWILVSSEDPGQSLLLTSLKASPSRVVFLARTTLALPFGPDSAFPSQTNTELIRQSTAIVALSNYLKEYLRRWGGCESVVLPIQLHGSGPFPQFGRFDVGCVTMVNPCAVKGLSIFLGLAREMPEISFAAV